MQLLRSEQTHYRFHSFDTIQFELNAIVWFNLLDKFEKHFKCFQFFRVFHLKHLQLKIFDFESENYGKKIFSISFLHLSNDNLSHVFYEQYFVFKCKCAKHMIVWQNCFDRKIKIKVIHKDQNGIFVSRNKFDVNKKPDWRSFQ